MKQAKQAKRVSHYYSFYHDLRGNIKPARETWLAGQVEQHGITLHADGLDQADADKMIALWNQRNEHFGLTRKIPESLLLLTC